MAKMRTSVLLIGTLILVLVTVVATYLILLLTNVIPKDPIKIEITIVDKEKTYDGTPLQADEYTINSGKLLSGHTLDLDYIGSITNSGTIKSNAVCHVYDKDHTDHTSEYIFTINQGNLTILKKQITLGIKKTDIDYTNDSDFTNKCEYEITAGGLCSGHIVKPTYKIENEDFEANEIEASLTAEIFDINGVNVTSNYSIDYNRGVVGVNKTSLVFKTLSKTKVYDGEAFGDDDFDYTLEYGVLPNGYKTEIEYDYAAKGDVGSTNLGISSVRILNELGDDVTNRFDIITVPDGILTINPVELDIAVVNPNKTYEYDGESHSYNEFEVKTTGSIKADKSDNSKFTYNGYSFTVVSTNSTEAINAGSYVNILDFIITDKFNEDVTDNFRINLDSAIITITKRNAILYGKNVTVAYDGHTHKLTESDGVEKEYGLINTTEIKHTPVVEYSKASQIQDAGSVQTEIFKWTIYDDNDNDVTANYNITTVNGLYTVTKEKVNIVCKAVGAAADADPIEVINSFYGENIFDFDYLNSVIEFKSDDNSYSLTVSKYNYSTIKHAGKYNLIPVEYVVKANEKTIDTKNYDISISGIEINIKRTSVFITVESKQVDKDSNERLRYEVIMQDDIGDFEDDFSISVSDYSTDEVGTFNVGVIFEKYDDESSIEDYNVYITPGILTVVEP